MEIHRILQHCVLASLCFLSSGAWAQVVTEFSAGISAGADLSGIAAGPDGNVWFTEATVADKGITNANLAKALPPP